MKQKFQEHPLFLFFFKAWQSNSHKYNNDKINWRSTHLLEIMNKLQMKQINKGLNLFLGVAKLEWMKRWSRDIYQDINLPLSSMKCDKTKQNKTKRV